MLGILSVSQCLVPYQCLNIWYLIRVSMSGTLSVSQCVILSPSVSQCIIPFPFYDVREEVKLGAVNSINWARVLAQMTYYFWAHFRVGR